jgi:hypothetical protein
VGSPPSVSPPLTAPWSQTGATGDRELTGDPAAEVFAAVLLSAPGYRRQGDSWVYLGFTDPTHGVGLATSRSSAASERLYYTIDAGASYHLVEVP